MPAMTNPYEVGLDKNAANYVPLTPIGAKPSNAAAGWLRRSQRAASDAATPSR